MSGNNPNLDYLSSLGMSFLPQSGSTSGSNFTSFTNVQTSPRVTTKTIVNNLTTGGTRSRSRSATPSPSRNNLYMGDSEINIADNVTLTGKGIYAGVGCVDKTKRVGPKSPTDSRTNSEEVDGHADAPNYPQPNININIGKNVTFNADNVVLGASYVQIIDHISDEEIKRRFHELIGDKLGGKLNVGSGESDESAKIQLKEAVRKTPATILKICSSICLILWEDQIGTGFLARIPGFKDVVLLTAGHNFTPGESFDEHVLYFKATDGDEKGKGVVKVPFKNIASRKFSLVSSCKGKRIIGHRKAGENEKCETRNHHYKKDDFNKNLDYCMITLPGWEKFIKDNKLDYLEVKDKVEDTNRVFYVGHPYMGFQTGDYHRDNADPKDDAHYAEVKLIDEDEGVYEWSNLKEESWKLYPMEEQDKFRVDEECPHYKSGYKEAEIKKNGQIILGPDKVPFYFQQSSSGEQVTDMKMAKALRFSYGSKKADIEKKTNEEKKTEKEKNADEEIKIKYTLDTKGGASGSPVLGDDYSVSAIHTFWKNTDKISGGIKISAVMKDLVNLKERYSSFFTEGPEEDFTIEKQCSWCNGPNPVEVTDDKKRIEELQKARDSGHCVLLHLKPKEITTLLNANENADVKLFV